LNSRLNNHNLYIQGQTTHEEYQAQRYEGACTLYGPHTLAAFLEVYRQMAEALVSSQPVPPGPPPPQPNPNQLRGFLPGVITDSGVRLPPPGTLHQELLKALVTSPWIQGPCHPANQAEGGQVYRLNGFPWYFKSSPSKAVPEKPGRGCIRTVPRGVNFGDVVTDVEAGRCYAVGAAVSVTFHSANPRNRCAFAATGFPTGD
jgi:hypothetical protein